MASADALQVPVGLVGSAPRPWCVWERAPWMRRNGRRGGAAG